MTIRLVTDSTADLPDDLAAQWGITVVPAYINVGQRSYLDGVELTRREFYDRLPSYESPPTTAAPAPAAFTQVYERLAAEGATYILSIHLAARLSGMFNTARLGAEATQAIPITLFDSEQISLGLGLLVLKAAERAAAGASLADILAALQASVPRTHVLATLNTLEYMRRSGRVNWAAFGLGTLLQLKPILHVYQGQLLVPEKTRTWGKAVTRLLELAAEYAPLERLAVLHTAAPAEAEALHERVASLAAGLSPIRMEVTPAIGAHAGPGAVGLAFIAAGEGGRD
ncbi:MAG: DegV family protein [Chloroflexota bacterium]